jgi:hypothetical protein
MLRLFAILSFILITITSFSQSSHGDLRMEKTFGGVKFFEGSRIRKPREVLQIMEVNPEAYVEFKKAKSSYDAAQVFGFVGGFMIGWPIGTAIGGGEPQWGLAAGGAAVLLLSVPISNGFKRHASKAISIYNSQSGTANMRPQFHLNIMGAGARMVVRF